MALSPGRGVSRWDPVLTHACRARSQLSAAADAASFPAALPLPYGQFVTELGVFLITPAQLSFGPQAGVDVLGKRVVNCLPVAGEGWARLLLRRWG